MMSNYGLVTLGFNYSKNINLNKQRGWLAVANHPLFLSRWLPRWKRLSAFLNSTSGACTCAGTAANACVFVNLVDVAFGDSSNGAFASASATSNTFVSDFVSHFFQFLGLMMSMLFGLFQIAKIQQKYIMVHYKWKIIYPPDCNILCCRLLVKVCDNLFHAFLGRFMFVKYVVDSLHYR